MWKLIAPSLFTCAPDIYVENCADVMDEYSHEENPLFIPKIRKDLVCSAYALYAFLGKNALCFSPFGIEDIGENENDELPLPHNASDAVTNEMMRKKHPSQWATAGTNL